MLGAVIAVASPSPQSTPATCAGTSTFADLYGTAIDDPATLRFIRILALAEPSVRRSAIDASRMPLDPSTTRAVDAALPAKGPCAEATATVAAHRMGDAVSQSWNVSDEPVAERLGNRLVAIARALAVRETIGAPPIDRLLSPFGTTLAALSTPPQAPAPDCPMPNVQANTIRIAQPAYPPIAVASGTTGTAQVRVDLDTDGNVVRVTLFKAPDATGPGAAAIVENTILAAGTTVYAPQIVACKATSGAYIFASSFTRR